MFNGFLGVSEITMSNQPYRCWCPEYNLNEDAAETILASSGRDAAENYAEYLYSFFSARFSSIEVHVKEGNNHFTEAKNYHVKVIIRPTFDAYITQ